LNTLTLFNEIEEVFEKADTSAANSYGVALEHFVAFIW
jgi:hypothetical protein